MAVVKRFAGLDSIRFCCALTVIFFHGISPPILSFLSRQTAFGRAALGLYDAAFNGQAAVIAFFVISGFCIHYPYAAGRPFAAIPFLAGRYTRIMIPSGAYLLLVHVVHGTDAELTLLLWSIWCELAYYTLYPLLRLAFAGTSIAFVLSGSYFAAIAVTVVVLLGRPWQGLFDAGAWTWLAGLPSWILGCLLAERIAKVADPAAVTARELWSWRLGTAGLGTVSYLAMLHLHVSFLISLQFFAVLVWLWLSRELRWYFSHPANRILEGLGAMTFSIYLMHMLARQYWSAMVSARGMLPWAAEIVFIIGLGALFYGLVERPAHIFARFLSRGFGHRVFPEATKVVIDG